MTQPEFDFADYQTNALRTNRADATAEENFHHAAMGLVTETAELVDAYKRHFFYKKPLDLVNIKEEVGDVLWYLALGFFSRDAAPKEGWRDDSALAAGSRDFTRMSEPETLMLSLTADAGVVHCSVLYEDMMPFSVNTLTHLLLTLSEFAGLHGFTLQEAADLNVEKLHKRYPQGFSEVDAVNRDKENELSHIKA